MDSSDDEDLAEQLENELTASEADSIVDSGDSLYDESVIEESSSVDGSHYDCTNDDDSSADDVYGGTKKPDSSELGLKGAPHAGGNKSSSDKKEHEGPGNSSVPTSSAFTENCVSSSDEGVSEKCPICLLSLKGKVALPDGGCNHVFCYECLKEWSKNVATCPIDRSEFCNLIVKSKFDGPETRKEAVGSKRVVIGSSREEEEEELLDDDPCLCEVCGAGDREDRLLLCDGCDLAFHLECLIPALDRVPRGRWYCPTCESAGLVNSRLPGSMANRICSSEDENVDVAVVPRTSQTERVRRVVQHRRKARRLTPVRGSTTVRRKKRMSRSSKTQSKTRRRAKTSSLGGTIRRNKVASTRTKGTRKTRRITSSRTAQRQGVEESCSERGLEDIGPRLSLFGDRDALEFYEDDNDPVPSTSDVALKPVLHVLEMSSSKPVAMVMPLKVEPSVTSSSFSLGNLLVAQSEMLKKSKPNLRRKGEIYSRPENILESERKSGHRVISTTISRQQQLLLASNKGKADGDPSKVKNSSKFSNSASRSSAGETTSSNCDLQSRPLVSTSAVVNCRKTEAARKRILDTEISSVTSKAKKPTFSCDVVVGHANKTPRQKSYNPYEELRLKEAQNKGKSYNKLTSAGTSRREHHIECTRNKSGCSNRKEVFAPNGNTRVISEISYWNYWCKADLQNAIVETVKGFLKPFYLANLIDKEKYKLIMKRCVDKVYQKSKQTRVLLGSVQKLVEAYVDKYVVKT